MITVTERLYRSGSDYLINRVPCRLRDVWNCLWIRVAARISIIGRGKVDEILSVKPEERRGLIGCRWPGRHRNVAVKLEDTENNLIRLNDIITGSSAKKNRCGTAKTVPGTESGRTVWK